MTARTKDAKVAGVIVLPVAVDVIDLDGDVASVDVYFAPPATLTLLTALGK